MRFLPTSLAGVIGIELERHVDERGYFARTWCDREAAGHGLRTPMRQHSIAFNPRTGTTRGLHYQAPLQQVRVIRCVAGAAFTVLVDLRRSSPTFLTPLALVLDGGSQKALYVPPGIAAGYQTLTDDTMICYQMADDFDPGSERGVRWNDPAFGITWPAEPTSINDRDAHYPDFDPRTGGVP